MDELLPCPFCGRAPSIECLTGNGVQVECICGARGPFIDWYYIGNTRANQEAIKGWNTRKEEKEG